MKPKSISIVFVFASLVVNSQQSGNTVYGQTNQSSAKIQAADKLYLSDSTFIIEANVIINVIADSYVATFGVAESSLTLADCNDKIEKRIQGFIAELTKLGVARSDIYVDMTTQNKIYDYKMNGNIAEQYLKGFEIKKNVIVKFINIKDLDKMVIAASGYQVYDLVKVDYQVTDINKIYMQLFQSAMEVIGQKKTLYLNATNAKLAPSSAIYGESFYSYTPSQLYKSYTAYESSEYYADYGSYKKKDLRKSATYYYDNINYSGFDRVINSIVTEPAVEFALALQVKFEIEKK